MSNAPKEEKTYRRHKRFWKFAHDCLAPIILKKFGCKTQNAPKLPEPYLVLSNHQTNLDPVIVGSSFKHQMYFVASEHIIRQGFVSKILFYVFDPITKMKGASDRSTVIKMLRTLKDGKNVCLFPDGNCSWNGRTGEITQATGKLCKASGANLVTYKITGGYFTTPRWGYKIRKGKMSGGIVNVYTKAQLENMSVEEVTEAIKADLNEDAYARQRSDMIKYRGKNLAEGMECAVCVCPVCHKIDSITTQKNSVNCTSCGHLADYNHYGFFQNQAPSFQFSTVEEWDAWQENFFSQLASKAVESESTQEFFAEKNIQLRTIDSKHCMTELGTGTLTITPQELLFKSSTTSTHIKIKITDLPDMSIYAKNGLVFSDSEGIHYEVVRNKKSKLINVRKFVSVWKTLKSIYNTN